MSPVNAKPHGLGVANRKGASILKLDVCSVPENLAEKGVNELRKQNECSKRQCGCESCLACAIFDDGFGGSFDLVRHTKLL